MKKCSKCEIEKPFSEFSKHPKGKNGLSSKCKSCHKQYREENKEKRKQYLKKNKEKIAEQNKKYREANKEKIAEYDKQYREANKEKISEWNKQWREVNKERRNEYRNQYQKQRRQTDPIYKFRFNVRCLIIRSFKRGSNQFRKDTKTEQILGCTIEEFRSYIESKFTEGMSFENQGKWHLDHIHPVSLAKTEEEIIRLNHYTNFQPLWAEENIRKGNRLNY